MESDGASMWSLVIISPLTSLMQIWNLEEEMASGREKSFVTEFR